MRQNKNLERQSESIRSKNALVGWLWNKSVMRRLFFSLSLIFIVPAFAQVADFGRGTCAAFAEARGEDRNQLLLWLHGYYSGAASRPLLDKSSFDKAMSNFNEFCSKNPDKPLIGIDIRAIMLGERSSSSAPSSQETFPPAALSSPGSSSSGSPGSASPPGNTRPAPLR
jgi:hypothetical protein